MGWKNVLKLGHIIITIELFGGNWSEVVMAWAIYIGIDPVDTCRPMPNLFVCYYISR